MVSRPLLCASGARRERGGRRWQTDLWIIVWQGICLRTLLLAPERLVVSHIIGARIYKTGPPSKEGEWERRTKSHSLPWPLCSVGRDQQPGPGQRVVPAVGDVVEDLVGHVAEETRTGRGRTAERNRGSIQSEVSRRVSRFLYGGIITRTNNPVIGPSGRRWCYSR